VEKEHSVIGENLKKIELYTNNFVPPANACTNHQVLYHKLHEVYNDLIQHKHLERNILFPKAIEIERELLQL
jgi:regulator of cell morphogenesis and NO signaling